MSTYTPLTVTATFTISPEHQKYRTAEDLEESARNEMARLQQRSECGLVLDTVTTEPEES